MCRALHGRGGRYTTALLCIGGTFTTVDDSASTVFNQALGINNSNETVGDYTLNPARAPGDIAYSQKRWRFH